MHTLIKRVVFGRSDPIVIRECRDCGAAVDADSEECQECGSAEISQYELG